MTESYQVALTNRRDLQHVTHGLEFVFDGVTGACQACDEIRDADPNGDASPIEVRLLAALHRQGLYPACQLVIGRRRVDFAFPDRLIAIEADGWMFHQDTQREHVRDAEIESHGWAVWHFPGWRINQDPDECASTIAEELQSIEVAT